MTDVGGKPSVDGATGVDGAVSASLPFSGSGLSRSGSGSMDMLRLCALIRLELFRRRGERPDNGGDDKERSSVGVGSMALLLPVRVCTDDKLGDAWFIVKPLKESVIGELSKSHTDRFLVADRPDRVRRVLRVCLDCIGGSPASRAPTRCDFRFALLKNGCVSSLSAVGRLDASFFRQVSIISLNTLLNG